MAYAPPFNDNPKKEEAQSNGLFLGLFALPVLLLGFSWFAFDLVRSAYTYATGSFVSGRVEKVKRVNRGADQIKVRFVRPGASAEESRWVEIDNRALEEIKKEIDQPVDLVVRPVSSTLDPVVVKDFRRRTSINMVGSLGFLYAIFGCVLAIFSSWRDRAEAIRNHAR